MGEYADYEIDRMMGFDYSWGESPRRRTVSKEHSCPICGKSRMTYNSQGHRVELATNLQHRCPMPRGAPTLDCR